MGAGAGAVVGHVGVIAAKDQRSIFQLRVRADYELTLSEGMPKKLIIYPGILFYSTVKKHKKTGTI